MPARLPNIVLITTDQQRADFLASEGFPLDTMPFLDEMGRRGVRFRNAYTTMPICIPARVSLFTGRYPKAHGVIANYPRYRPRYEADLADILRAQGYELGLFGKNHTHLTEEDFDVFHPYMHTAGPPRPGREDLDRAFDAWMENLGHWVAEGPTPFPLSCQYPARIVDEALDWLKTRRGKRPFFAWVSFPEPHSPYQVPEPYYSLFPPDKVPAPVAGVEALREKNAQWWAQRAIIVHHHPDLDEIIPRYRSLYCGMLRLIDDQLSRLVSFLEESRMLDDTIVIYLADHGEFCGEYGLVRKGLALPEVSIRIPMVAFGGPVVPSQQARSEHVSIADVLPTFCEAAGAALPRGVQGRSLWPLLTGVGTSTDEFRSIVVQHGVGGRIVPFEGPDRIAPRDQIRVDGRVVTNFDGTATATSGYRWAVIRDGWKLVYDLELPAELYNLNEDPYELCNLARRDESTRPAHLRAKARTEPRGDERAGSGAKGAQQMISGETARIYQDLLQELLWWCIRLDDNLDIGTGRYQAAVPPHNWYGRLDGCS